MRSKPEDEVANTKGVLPLFELARRQCVRFANRKYITTTVAVSLQCVHVHRTNPFFLLLF